MGDWDRDGSRWRHGHGQRARPDATTRRRRLKRPHLRKERALGEQGQATLTLLAGSMTTTDDATSSGDRWKWRIDDFTSPAQPSRPPPDTRRSAALHQCLRAQD